MNCEDVKKLLLDYKEDLVNEKIKNEIEEHIQNCSQCKRELDEIISVETLIKENKQAIKPYDDFSSNVREKLSTKVFHKNSRRFKAMRTGIIICAIAIICAFTVIASENGWLSFYKRYANQESLRAAVNNGYETQINMSKIDKDIKLTIAYAVADDTETAVFYEIKDLKGKNKYYVDYSMDSVVLDKCDKDFCMHHARLLSSNPNSTLGKIVIPKVEKNNDEINLKINKLQLVNEDKKSNVKVDGNWNFKFKVKKYPSKTYTLNKEVTIYNKKIKFTTIQVAPTKTILTYQFKNGINNNSKERFLGLRDMYISSKGKKYLPLFLGSQSTSTEMATNSVEFDSMYFDNPKDIKINISSYILEDSKEKNYELNLNKPTSQTFDFYGTKISLDKLNINNGYIELSFKRDLKTLNVENPICTLCTDNSVIISQESGLGDSVFIDKYDNQYEVYNALGKWEEIRDKKPVMYIRGQKEKCKVTTKDNIPLSKEDIRKIKFKVNIQNEYKTVWKKEKLKLQLNDD